MSSLQVVAPQVPPRNTSRCLNWSSVMRTLVWPRIHSIEENNYYSGKRLRIDYILNGETYSGEKSTKCFTVTAQLI